VRLIGTATPVTFRVTPFLSAPRIDYIRNFGRPVGGARWAGDFVRPIGRTFVTARTRVIVRQSHRSTFVDWRTIVTSPSSVSQRLLDDFVMHNCASDVTDVCQHGLRGVLHFTLGLLTTLSCWVPVAARIRGWGLAPPKNFENFFYLPNKSRANFQNPLTILLHTVTILHLNN